MEPLPGARSRGTRLALVALGLFVLLAIVGFASRSGFGGSSDAKPSTTTINYAFSIFLVLFVLAIPFTIYAFFLQGREAAAERTRSFKRLVIQNLLTFAFFIGVVSLLLYLRHLHPEFLRFRDSGAGKAANAARKAGAKQHATDPTFERPVLYAAIVLLIVLGAAVFVMHRRRKAGRRGKLPREQAAIADELSAEISDAIDDLEAEPDFRRAVIAAYARMEGALTRHGIPRRPSETPFEYLARVLLDLRAPSDAVRRLTEAFERAKFSRHEIDAQAKREAIGALVAVRDGLHPPAEAA